MLLLHREAGFISLKGLRQGIGHKVTGRGTICALSLTPIAGYQLLRQEIWDLAGGGFPVIMDPEPAGKVKARVLVKVDVPLHLQQADALPEAFEAYEAGFPVKEKHLVPGQLPQFCQSCGKPLTRDEDCALEADGSFCFDYCKYCYQNGK